jgi:hypothetical protein
MGVLKKGEIQKVQIKNVDEGFRAICNLFLSDDHSNYSPNLFSF